MRWLLQTTTPPSRSTPFSAGPDHLDSRSFVLRNECRTNPRVRPDRVYLDGADVERDDRILLRGCADHRDLTCQPNEADTTRLGLEDYDGRPQTSVTPWSSRSS